MGVAHASVAGNGQPRGVKHVRCHPRVHCARHATRPSSFVSAAAAMGRFGARSMPHQLQTRCRSADSMMIPGSSTPWNPRWRSRPMTCHFATDLYDHKICFEFRSCEVVYRKPIWPITHRVEKMFHMFRSFGDVFLTGEKI